MKGIKDRRKKTVADYRSEINVLKGRLRDARSETAAARRAAITEAIAAARRIFARYPASVFPLPAADMTDSPDRYAAAGARLAAEQLIADLERLLV